jgi:hypothetical protein
LIILRIEPEVLLVVQTASAALMDPDLVVPSCDEAQGKDRERPLAPQFCVYTKTSVSIIRAFYDRRQAPRDARQDNSFSAGRHDFVL